MAEDNFYKKAVKFKTPALLLSIFLIGFSIVYLPHGPRLSDPDAWFQYRMAQYVLEDGEVPDVYTLAYYPEGRRPWAQDTLTLPYFFAYTYKLVEPFGLQLMSWALLFPAIFGGGLAAVFLYLAVKELFGPRIGFLSALFYSFIPLNLTRVYSGTIDKEVLYGVFVFLSLYFFLKAYKKGISMQEPKILVYPILSGIFYGFAYSNWSGGAYVILVITLAAVIYTFFKLDRELLKVLLVVGMVGPVVMKVLQPPKYPLDYFTHSLPIIAPIAISFFLLFSLFVSDILKDKYGRKVHFLKVLSASLAVLIGVSFLIGKGELIQNYLSAAIGLVTLEKGVQQDIYMATVAESQPSSLFGPGETITKKISTGDFYRNLHILLLIIPIGVILLLKLAGERKEFSYILAIVWIVSGFIAALQGKRLLFFLAPSAVVISGLVFIYAYEKLRFREKNYSKILKRAKAGRKKYTAEGGLTNIRVGYILLAVIIFGVTLSTLDVAIATMGSRQSDLSTPWYDALIWTKENTPENSVVFFWWDYGYYFQAVADRFTISDGGGNVPRNVVLANMFTSPEEEAMEYIKRFVDYEKIPTYMVVSYEEFGKSEAINRIAAGDPNDPFKTKSEDGQLYLTSFRVPKSLSLEQDEATVKEIFSRNQITTYYILDIGKDYLVWVLIQVDSQGNYHPEWGEKLLVKLLPFNNGLAQGLKHFELVYTDSWNYVFIYKVK